MQWPSDADPYENDELANSKHLKGTNNWIFDCRDWKAWAEASSSFLCLSGFPGSGKTTLFSQVASRLLEQRQEGENGVGVAYFYCGFRRQQFQYVKEVIRSIVAQLCSERIYPYSLVNAHRNTKTPGQSQHPSWDVLADTISSLSEEHKIFVLIDAVDECEEGKDIVTFFSKLRDQTTKLSVFLTGREKIVTDLGCQSWPVLKMETHRVEVDPDIRLYIQNRLDADESLRILSSGVKNEIQDSLNQRCAGMFRLAQCKLDDIAQMRNMRAIRSSLAKLPKGLEETYERILKKTGKMTLSYYARFSFGHATSLYYAASFGLEDVAGGLLLDGADVNAPGGRFGSTALHGATLREHTSIVEMLLKVGANPSQADDNHVTPLHTAATVGNPQVLKLLLDHGASKDSLGKTPYDWAVESGQYGSQKLLKGEVYEMLPSDSTTENLVVYQRPTANFPSLMVAQGLPGPSLTKGAAHEPQPSWDYSLSSLETILLV
ncbi:hypothetical protein O1611_g6315 [Lasiodiplodia mahajangana]|uniref:Uncharacterized protein n=1 Tax=Lasiodiplodia mahajangana TaxID=1108764 RepID=A0ACC2JIX4_9PEZI|nr:hypothetical protein O1611_g6315 [Lasiodiplodia mahajangana]